MFDRVNTAIYNALDEAEIESPFPTRELIHKFDPKDVDNFRNIIHDEDNK